MEIHRKLLEYEQQGNTIRVGVVGAGQMGEGLVAQMEFMHGMHAFAVADIRPGVAKQALTGARVPESDIVETDDAATASQAVRDGRRVATTDFTILPHVAGLDIVVEATGIPEIGARVSLQAILERKHVLQMNVETDATVGYILRKMARSAGIVYTLTAGDEPGATMELVDFTRALGFEVVCAGKGKNNPLDRHANPDTVAEKAKKQMMNPKMLASFVDGTKTMVEMTSLGNGAGLVTDVRGMHGPQATPKTIQDVFQPKSDGGVLEKTGVVDYGIGIAPGVFVVFTTDHPKIARDLGYLSMGPGPNWALYRPYHLTSLETPNSIAAAVLDGETTVATDNPPVNETVAFAKRELRAGESIDALGGFTVYGMIERADVTQAEGLLPIGLAPGAKLVKDVPQDQPITYGDVELDESSTIVQLRRMQDTSLV
jgi:predicted homoserine dehydrogenase-like protein